MTRHGEAKRAAGRTPGLHWPRVAAAGAAATLVAATLFAIPFQADPAFGQQPGSAGTAACPTPDTGRGDERSLASLAGQGGNLRGDPVTVRGQVGQVIDGGVFALGADPNSVLVVNQNPGASAGIVGEGRQLQVTGTAHTFDLAGFEQAVGADLPDQLAQSWAGRAAIIATCIEQATAGQQATVGQQPAGQQPVASPPPGAGQQGQLRQQPVASPPPGAGQQTIQLPPRSVELPAQRIELPAQTIQMPAQAVEVPARRIEIPAQQIEIPAQAIQVPAQAIELPARRVEVPAQAVQVPAQAVELPQRTVEVPPPVVAAPPPQVEVPPPVVAVPPPIVEQPPPVVAVPEPVVRQPAPQVTTPTPTPRPQAGPVQPVQPTGAAGREATIDEVLDNPTAYVGQVVAVTGQVDEIRSARAFTIEDEDFLFSEELLVVSARDLGLLPGTARPAGQPGTDVGPVRVDDDVRVVGTVRLFALADVEREIGVDLDDAEFAEFEGRPAVIAQEVTPVTAEPGR